MIKPPPTSARCIRIIHLNNRNSIPSAEREVMASKVFIITGASKGIGAAITKYLLDQSHKVVITARSRGPLEELQKSHPDQVQFIDGDMTQSEVNTFMHPLILAQRS
jgi:short-subunit dehydrogenase